MITHLVEKSGFFDTGKIIRAFINQGTSDNLRASFLTISLRIIDLKGKITWQGDVVFQAESGTGHSITIDGPPDMGGKNKGVRPMELLLLGTAGCSTFDVLTMLKKGRQDVTDCVCEVDAERADEIPAVFTKIHLHFVVTGRALKAAQVKRAVQLSAEKYCSASIMLTAAGVDITHDYEVVEA